MLAIVFVACGALCFLTATLAQTLNVPGTCAYYNNMDGSYTDCEINFDTPGEYTFSQCGGEEGGYCETQSGNPTMTVVGYEADVMVESCTSGAICPKVTFNVLITGPYTLRQSCGDVVGSCGGNTYVSFTGDTSEPTLEPTNFAFDTNPGSICDSFNLPADPTNTKYKGCMFNPTEGLVRFTMCGSGLDPPNDQAYASVTNIQLAVYDSSGNLAFPGLTQSNNCGWPEIIVDFAGVTLNGPYELRQKCGDLNSGCSGSTAIFSIGYPSIAPTDEPIAAPIDAPTAPPSQYVPDDLGLIDSAGAGATCTQFVGTTQGDSATCKFRTCSGVVVISQCSSDNPISPYFDETPGCSGSTQLALRLASDHSTLVMDTGGGACQAGCSKIVFPVTTGCTDFEVVQTCILGSPLCSGRTGVWWAGVLTEPPSTAPTDAPVSDPTAAPTADPTASPTVEWGPMPDPTVSPSRTPTTVPGSGVTNFHASTYKVKNGFAFAAWAADGTVHTWGEAPYGGDSAGADFGDNVTSIVASRFAYVATNEDGTLVPWGASGAIAGSVAVGPVSGLVANEGAFAAIQVGTKAVIALGSKHNGGNVTNDLRCNGFADELAFNVQSITASACAFTALKTDGTVYSWGNVHCGAGVSSLSNTALVGVQKVVATREAFAALLSTGAVVTWGGKYAGGDATSTGTALNSGVVEIIAGRDAFIAVKVSGGLVVWGYGSYGGDASAVQQYLNSDVKSVAQTFSAFAALKENGDVYTWGRADSGGDSSAVAASLHNIVSIHGAGKAFAAINSTGGVVAWGRAAYGGVIPLSKAALLSSNVVSIHSTDRAFLALKANGQVVVWGQAGHGGSPGTTVEALLASKVVHTVCSNDAAFSVITTEGKVIGWGHPISVAVPGVIFTSASLTTAAKCA